MTEDEAKLHERMQVLEFILSRMRRELHLYPWSAVFGNTVSTRVFGTKCYVDTIHNQSANPALVTLYDGAQQKIVLSIAPNTVVTNLAIPFEQEVVAKTDSAANSPITISGRIRW